MVSNVTIRSIMYMCGFRVLILALACAPSFAADNDPPLSAREQKLLDRIDTLEQRLASIEARLGATPAMASANQVQPPNRGRARPEARPQRRAIF